MDANIVSRGFTQVQFIDQYGEERVIYRQSGKALRVKKKQDTVSHILNRSAGILMGQRIKALRIERGYTLDALLVKAGLAAGAGQGKQRMFEIENAGVGAARRQKQGIRFGTLYALAIALECDVAELMPSAAEVARHAGVALIAPKEAALSKVA